MEKLKNLKEIMEPDPRMKMVVVMDGETGTYRDLMLADIYEGVTQIQLHDGVPEKIRSHFATALNLLVYSWFYYPFNVTAQFFASVSVEYALRERLKEKSKVLFRQLMKLAVEQGLIKDDGFSHLRKEAGEKEKVVPMGGFEWSAQHIRSFSQFLVDALPDLRNEQAHGSQMLHPLGAIAVRVCAELINQLYEKPRS